MDAKPELMLDVKEYEIDTDRLRDAGLNLPTSFQVFSIPFRNQAGPGRARKSVIDQLNRTGTIDPSTISPSQLANLLALRCGALFSFWQRQVDRNHVPSISAKLSMKHLSPRIWKR